MAVSTRAAALAFVLALGLAGAGPARAAEYEVFIDIETEEDLYDLFAAQEISEDTFETLLSLVQRGVELNTASREELYNLPNLTYAQVDAILDYREQVGWIRDPAALVTAGVLGAEELLAIAPFLVVRERAPDRLGAAGWVRAQTRWASEDALPPPAGLRARVTTLGGLTAGLVALVSPRELGDVVYDPNRDALSTTPPDTRAALPKVFARWESAHVDAIVGSYRIGFGQRLTFDNSREYDPAGIYLDDQLVRDSGLVRACREAAGELAESPCAGAPGDVYVSPDFRSPEGLFGAAAGARALPLGTGTASAHGFASVASRSIYQYEIYDRGRCADPRADDDPACAAPPVFVRAGDVLAPSSRTSFRTLPAMYRETLAGGNVSYQHDRRTQLGVTGYGATVDWLTEGIDLDFQEWSRRPWGGPFGAVGIDAAWGRGPIDLFAEAAHSFDGTDTGGGPAALLRLTASFADSELEASARYYDTDHANPYARPISAPDEYDGLRARDEAGGRLRWTGTLADRFRVRVSGDVWVQPSDGAPKAAAYLRVDTDGPRGLGYGLWLDHQDRDVRAGGRGQCYETAIEVEGEPVPCAGMRTRASGRLRWKASRALALSTQYDHELLDDPAYPDGFRQDISAWLAATWRASPRLRARARVRYLFEDIADSASMEQSLWSYLELGYRLRARDRLRLRYDAYVWLDDRASTRTRVPSPEHWLWLEVESRF